MGRKKFKTQYTDLPSIEKRLESLVLEDSRRGLSKKEQTEWEGLIKIARELRLVDFKKNNILELRKKKIDKIKTNIMGV